MQLLTPMMHLKSDKSMLNLASRYLTFKIPVGVARSQQTLLRISKRKEATSIRTSGEWSCPPIMGLDQT